MKLFNSRLIVFLSALGILLGGAPSFGNASENLTQSESQRLVHFLQSYLKHPIQEFNDHTTWISTAWIPADQNSGEEVLVYISGPFWCGSGGCTLLSLQPVGSSFKVIGRTGVVRLPVTLLPTTTNGHPDIGVFVQGGGIIHGYNAILKFAHGAYPISPFYPLAQRLPISEKGTVLFAPSVMFTGTLLFK